MKSFDKFYCQLLLFKIVGNLLHDRRCAEATFLLSFSSSDFEDCFLVSSVTAFDTENWVAWRIDVISSWFRNATGKRCAFMQLIKYSSHLALFLLNLIQKLSVFDDANNPCCFHSSLSIAFLFIRFSSQSPIYSCMRKLHPNIVVSKTFLRLNFSRERCDELS